MRRPWWLSVDAVLVLYKFLMSFRKRRWELGDYPIRVWCQQAHGEAPAGGVWYAKIVNWWLIGAGDSRHHAMEELRSRFEKYRQTKALPRPGVRVPIEIASSENIERHGDFAFEFVERVTGLEPLLMTDRTTLADFCTRDDDDEEALHRKAALLYNVDTSESLRTPLWQVLDRVTES